VVKVRTIFLKKNIKDVAVIERACKVHPIVKEVANTPRDLQTLLRISRIAK
jgi:hypothetical protein